MEATFGTVFVAMFIMVSTIVFSPILAVIPWPWIDPEDAR